MWVAEPKVFQASAASAQSFCAFGSLAEAFFQPWNGRPPPARVSGRVIGSLQARPAAPRGFLPGADEALAGELGEK